MQGSMSNGGIATLTSGDETRKRRSVLSRNLEPLLFAVLVAIAVLPVLVFQYFPSEDGPAHIANAAVYLYGDSPLFQEYYDLGLFPVPNLLGDLVLAAFLPFASPALAERLVVAGLVVGLPYAVRRCVGLLDPTKVWLAALAIPLGLGLSVYKGLINFALGVVLSFVAFGFWSGHLRDRARGIGRWSLFAALILLVYFCHPVPFLALVLMIGAQSLNDALEASQNEARGVSRLLWRRLAPVAIVVMAPLVLLIVFFFFYSDQGTTVEYYRGFGQRVRALPIIPVIAVSSYEVPFALLPPLAIGVLGLWAVFAAPPGQRWRLPGFLLAVVVLVVLYFVLPDRIGQGQSIHLRLAVYMVPLALLWLAGRPLPTWAKGFALLVAAVAVVGLTTVRLPAHATVNEDIEEYLSGQHMIAPGSTILPLFATEPLTGRGFGGEGRIVSPLVERAAYVTSEGDVVDLHHLTASLDIFPFRFREGYDISQSSDDSGKYPFVFGPGLIDIEQYEQGPGTVDYVWLWGMSIAKERTLQLPESRHLLDQLESNYERVFVSEPRGLVEIYEKKDRS